MRAARIAAEAGARVGAGRGVPLRRHLRDPRLHPEEAHGLRQRLRRRLRGRRAATAGPSARRGFDWAALIAAKDAEIARLEAAYRDRLRRAGVQLCARPRHRRRPAPGAPRRPARSTRAEPSPRRHRRRGRSCRTSPAPSSASPRTRSSSSRPSRSGCSIVGGGYVACEFAGIMNGLGTHVTQLYRGEPDPARLRRRPPRPRRRRHARARHRARDPARRDARSSGPSDGAEGQRRQRRDAPGRPGALRHRPRPQHRRPRARGARRRLAGERRGGGRRLVADRGALDLRGRRRHRPRGADAGGDRTRARPSPRPSSPGGRGARTMR